MSEPPEDEMKETPERGGLLEDVKSPESLVANEATSTEKWYQSAFPLLYISHFLSSWGDRMWEFTMGMLLVDWENLQSLRTVAVHQLCQAVAVIIFGALIGAWVDRTRRLRASFSSIISQNVSVTASATVLLVLLKTTEDRNKSDPALWQHHLAVAISIGFSTLAHLASVACQLTVLKDWVPALCNENRAKLTATNATLKRIDLTTAILSPLPVGAAMELFGPWAGGVAVVVWNIVSAPCEIALLYAVYRKSAQLQIPKKKPESAATDSEPTSNCCCTREPFFRPAVLLVRGWGTYWRQTVRWSGASLSALYFTVLSFDAVTTAYVRSLCVSELVVAAVRIGSFVFGLVGTIVFPHIRKRFGLRCGGAIFYVGHAAILGIAATSILLPGSPFGPINSGNQPAPENLTSFIISPINETLLHNNQSNLTTSLVVDNNGCVKGDDLGGLRLPHLAVLMSAVVLSRLTLWGTDLSINQVLVERVAAEERGVVNGVQGSLNQLVDLIRLVSVISFPYPSQFGYLIVATFTWISSGAILYIVGSPPDEIPASRPNDFRMNRFSSRRA